MQKREYILNGSLINDLGDFIMTFAWFAHMGDGKESELSKRDISIAITNDEIKERYETTKNKDENLNRLNDYVWQMAHPMDGNIQESDHILLRILDSDYLREILGFEVTENYLKAILGETLNLGLITSGGIELTQPQKRASIGYDMIRLLALQNGVQNLSLFETVTLMIIGQKKIRLQLE